MPRLKTCKAPECGREFTPERNMQVACGPRCAIAYQRHQREAALKRKWAREAREYRAKERSKRAKGRGESGPKRQAVDALHEFIKWRDYHKPCIVHGPSCPNDSFDAGHFLSAGSHPELRFNTWNIHKQCSLNNRGSHKRSRWNGEGTSALYERRLAEKIGRERVEWLKGPHAPKQYRDDDYRRIARIFRRRAKHYKKLRGIE